VGARSYLVKITERKGSTRSIEVRVARRRVTTGSDTDRGLAPARRDVHYHDEASNHRDETSEWFHRNPPCAGWSGEEVGTVFKMPFYRDSEAVSRPWPTKARSSASSCCWR